MELARLAPRRILGYLAEGIDGPLLTLSLALAALGLATASLSGQQIFRRRASRRRR